MTDLPRPALSKWHRGQVALLFAAILVVCVAVGLILQGNLKSSSGRALTHTGASSVTGGQTPQRLSTIMAWSFTGGVPSGWSILAKTTSTPSGVLVGTTDTAGYQLVSPPVFVVPGSYRISVILRIISGGIGLEALDTTGRHFLVNRIVNARGVGLRTITAQFSVHEPGNVFVVMSNSTKGVRSSWMLQDAALRRITSGR